MKLCMIGTGYVGLVSGTCFADIGHTVYCVDKDEAKIEKLNSSQSPIYEPGLDEMIKENYKASRLFFTSNLSEAVNKSDIIFICVGTPNKRKSLSVELKFVYQAAKDIKKVSKGKKIIVTKSTVPVGTGDQIEKILKNSKKFTVVSNPEFLREGEAIRDFKYPDRIVIGSNSSSIFKTMKNLYSPLINKGSKFFTTNRRGAELIKYAANAFLATKITYINEIANLCEKINVNVEDVSLGIGSDLRIGSRFLRAGPSYGGSCFPKDTKGLISIGEKEKVDLSIVKSVVKSNENRKKLILNKISKILKNKIKNKKVSILGVTFKPKRDFKKYPRNINKDIKILEKENIKFLYLPDNKDIYSFKPVTPIYLHKFSKELCGKFRPGHFKGVINVVNRFLEIIKPKYLFLGEKDLQQLILIQMHIIKNKIKTIVVPCKTLRSNTGIALSSRNLRLNRKDLKIASKISYFLHNNKKKLIKKLIKNQKKEIIKKIYLLGAKKIDYIEAVSFKKFKIIKRIKNKLNIFIAYYLNDVRLIDNL